MKYLPKYTPTEVRNDPYGFTYKEMSEVIGENEAKALYSELYKQAPRKKNLSMLVKDIYKSSDTEKYVYELKDNKYIETVFIKRRDGGTVCVSTQVGCPVGCIFCESGRNGFVRNLTPSEIVQQVILLRRKVNRIVFMGMGEPLFNYDNLIKAIHILRDRYLYTQQHNLQEIVLFLTCTYMLLKMLLSKPYPILKDIIEKLYLRICFYQV